MINLQSGKEKMLHQFYKQEKEITANRALYQVTIERSAQLEHLILSPQSTMPTYIQELQQLKENQILLTTEYESHCKARMERNHILQHPTLLLCYLSLQNKLNEWFLAYKTLNTKNVSCGINVLGDFIPFPTLSTGIFSLGQNIDNLIKDEKRSLSG